MRWRALVALAALAAGPLAARAEHAQIDLKVLRVNGPAEGADAEVSAGADAEPPLGGHNPRPLLKVKAGEPLVLQFIFTNTYPHGVRKDVTVHYFVVREKKARQKDLPDLKEGVVTRGRFRVNFKPKCKVGARVAFTIKEPGFYLVRVHSAHTQSDHEHFAALDLKAE